MTGSRAGWVFAVLGVAVAGTAEAGGQIGGHASTATHAWGNAAPQGLGFNNTQNLGFSNFGRPGFGAGYPGHRGGHRSGYYNPGYYGFYGFGPGFYVGPAPRVYVLRGYRRYHY